MKGNKFNVDEYVWRQKMKVLWASNIPLQPLLQKYGSMEEAASGSWMNSLWEILLKDGGIELAAISPFDIDDNKLNKWTDSNGATYYYFPYQKYICPLTPHSGKRYENRIMKYFQEAIEDYSPDLIHVHGTEKSWGMIKSRNHIQLPLIVSIQGIMEMCSRFAWGEKSIWEMLFIQKISLTNIVHCFPNLWKKAIFLVKVKREQQILREADCIIGRTLWDRAYARFVAPDTEYRVQHEIMRNQFYHSEWKIESSIKKTVFSSGRISFAKGLHILLKVIEILKRHYNDIILYYAGGYDSNDPEVAYILKQIDNRNLNSNVILCGHMNTSEMISLMLSTNAFVTASFIENGCNSLQEAQLLGMPCIATYAGGMTSTAHNCQDALMAPVGNEYMIAEQLCRVFEDETLATKLSRTARKLGKQRNDPKAIITTLKNVYEEYSSSVGQHELNTR